MSDAPPTEADASDGAVAVETRSHRVYVMGGLAITLVVVAGLRMLVGESMPRDFEGNIIWEDFGEYLQLRWDRILVATVVGAALSVAGAVLQSLLRNPLASPYILGVSTGAAVGVVLALTGWVGVLGVFGTNAAALAGALGTMAIVYAMAQKRGRVDPMGLLLVGVILNAINAAAIMFVQSLEPGIVLNVTNWMMGSLDRGAGRDTIAGMSAVVLVGAATLVGIAIAAWLGRAMDLATFSDTEARAMGVSLDRLRLVLFTVAGVLTAGAVMLAGPIGFIGLICPHAVRLMIGPTNRWVVIGSALAGASVLIMADTATKLIDTGLGVGKLPVGVLTALIGGPLFIVMLRPHLGRGGVS